MSLAHNGTLADASSLIKVRGLAHSLARNSTLTDLLPQNFLPVVTTPILASGMIAVASFCS